MSEQPHKVEHAKDFLRQLLSDGPVRAEDIQSEAKAALIAWRTIQRAKEKLGVKAIHPKIPGPWFWTMSTKAAKATPSHNVGGLGGSLAALQERQALGGTERGLAIMALHLTVKRLIYWREGGGRDDF